MWWFAAGVILPQLVFRAATDEKLTETAGRLARTVSGLAVGKLIGLLLSILTRAPLVEALLTMTVVNGVVGALFCFFPIDQVMDVGD